MVDPNPMSKIKDKNLYHPRLVMFCITVFVSCWCWQISVDAFEPQEPENLSSSNGKVVSGAPAKINPPIWFSLIVVCLLGLFLLNSGMFFFLKKRRSLERQTKPEEPSI